MATVLQDKLEEDADGFPGVSLKGFQVPSPRQCRGNGGGEVAVDSAEPGGGAGVHGGEDSGEEQCAERLRSVGGGESAFHGAPDGPGDGGVGAWGGIFRDSDARRQPAEQQGRGGGYQSARGLGQPRALGGGAARLCILCGHQGQPRILKQQPRAFLWSDSYLLSAGPIVTENLDSKRMVELK